jgi:hypothetical protein
MMIVLLLFEVLGRFWVVPNPSVSDPFQSQISVFGNELAKSIPFEQSCVEMV